MREPTTLMNLFGHRPLQVLARNYPNGYQVSWHSHPQGQLLYPATGVMSISTERQFFLVPPQQALWIPARLAHQLAVRGELTLRSLYIDEAPTHFPVQAACFTVTPLLRELLLRTTDFGGKQESPMTELIFSECQFTPTLSLPLPPSKPSPLYRLCQALIKTPGNSQTLRQWATQVGASERALQRYFQQYLGVSFVLWRQQLRVLQSQYLLAGGSPVLEVAQAMGYHNASAFSSIYQRITGQTPSHYLAALR